jgi:hypothetical protein
MSTKKTSRQGVQPEPTQAKATFPKNNHAQYSLHKNSSLHKIILLLEKAGDKAVLKTVLLEFAHE